MANSDEVLRFNQDTDTTQLIIVGSVQRKNARPGAGIQLLPKHPCSLAARPHDFFEPEAASPSRHRGSGSRSERAAVSRSLAVTPAAEPFCDGPRRRSGTG